MNSKETDMSKFNKVPYRIDTIRAMTKGKIIDCMIDIKTETDVTQSNDDIRGLLPKKYIELRDAINDLGGKLMYIKSGSTGHTFKGVYSPNEHKPNYAVKVVPYPRKEDYGDMFNIKRPENAELLMIFVLTEFVKNRHTQHIALPITTFNTSIKYFTGLAKSEIVNNNKKYDEFLAKYNKGEYYDNVSILISEWANGGDLGDYIKNNFKSLELIHWKVIIFQILSVLAVIQQKYPAFRHNDLKANNLLVHNIQTNNKKYKYKINGQTYIIPNVGIILKLWDFDFACIPGVVDNSKVDAKWTKSINIRPEQNKYYDLHYFFSTLTKKGFFPEFWNPEYTPVEIRDFVNRIIPDKYAKDKKYVTSKGRLLVNDEFTTPDYVLKNDPLFESLRAKNITKSAIE